MRNRAIFSTRELLGFTAVIGVAMWLIRISITYDGRGPWSDLVGMGAIFLVGASSGAAIGRMVGGKGLYTGIGAACGICTVIALMVVTMMWTSQYMSP
jgi:predicted MFS family arabinose efflux permease